MKRLLSLLSGAALVLSLGMSAQAAGAADAAIAPSGMAMVEGVLYVTDTYHRAIWTVENGEASLLAGRTQVTDLSGQPVAGYNDGPFGEAAFSEPWAIMPYMGGFLVSDAGNHVLRYVNLDQGRVYTAAGTGEAGFCNQTGEMAAFDTPTGLTVDEDGMVYIADTGNDVIRAMDENGNVTTYAGGEEGCALGDLKQVQFSGPTGLCWANGVLYVADTGNHRIVALEDGEATLVAGIAPDGDEAYGGGYLNGPVELAQFASPQGIAVGTDGTVYVADTGNGAVRAIREGYVTTLLSSNRSGTSLVSPRSLLCSGDTLYVGDVFARVLLSIEAKVEKPFFSDVKEEAWYAQAVRFAVDNGLFAGVAEHVFAPDQPMTRAMIVTVLARLEGVDTTVGSTWYDSGRQWAVKTGISDGSDMDSPLTREQLATMLWRCAGSPGTSGNMDTYADADTVSAYAQQAMAWCVAEGIIGGASGTTLSPQDPATRAQVAMMIQRFCARSVEETLPAQHGPQRLPEAGAEQGHPLPRVEEQYRPQQQNREN